MSIWIKSVAMPDLATESLAPTSMESFSVVTFLIRLLVEALLLHLFSDREKPLNLWRSLSLASRTGPGSPPFPVVLKLSCIVISFSELL